MYVVSICKGACRRCVLVHTIYYSKDYISLTQRTSCRRKEKRLQGNGSFEKRYTLFIFHRTRLNEREWRHSRGGGEKTETKLGISHKFCLIPVCEEKISQSLYSCFSRLKEVRFMEKTYPAETKKIK